MYFTGVSDLQETNTQQRVSFTATFQMHIKYYLKTVKMGKNNKEPKTNNKIGFQNKVGT